MNHLSDSEFVDGLEGRLSGVRLEHAGACAKCRAELDRLRAAVALAEADAADEPSPLFWAHFGSRVSDAIRAESIEPAQPAWRAWLVRPVVLATAAAAVVVLAVSVVTRIPVGTPREASPGDAARVTVRPNQPDPGTFETDNLDDDAAWAVVRTAAEGLDWDDAGAAGLQAQPGAADRMALELTEAERIELMRILEHEMKRSGA